MSTYWYFECLSHDPPLMLGEEFTQHTDDTAFKRGVELAHSRPIDPEWWDRHSLTDDYFTANACRALTGHDTCVIGIVNEYGERRPLPTPTESETQ